MEIVFTFNKKARYTVYGTALFLGLIFAILLGGMLTNKTGWGGGKWVVVILLSLIGSVVAGLAWNAYRWRLTFLPDRLRFRSSWGEKEYLFRDLSGYRPGDLSQIKVVGANGRTVIHIPAQSVDYEAILRQLSMCFPNLDAQDQRTELQRYAQAWAENGDTSTDAWGRLAQMQRIAQWVNMGCGVLALLLILVPQVSSIEVLLAILLPPAMMVGARYSKGGILVFNRPNSQLPNFGLGMILVCLSLSFSALFGLNLLDPFELWLPGLVVFVLALAAMLYSWGDWPGWNKDGFNRLYIVALFAFMYTLGTVGWLNSLLDWSAPQQATAEILAKEEERHLWIFTCEFQLDAVGDRAIAPKVEVSRAVFGQYQPNDRVQVFWHPGAFGAAWVEDVQ